jgi:Bacterial Ig domain
MSAHRGPRLWYVSLAIGVALPLAPGTASAAAPVCEGGPFLYALPAGLTHLNPRADCKDPDGDPITIEVRTPPHLGTLSPEGTVPIDELRFYTANADAATLPAPRDMMTFVAHAGGEESNPIRLDVRILPPDHAPVCQDLAVSVEAGHSVSVPAPQCADADNSAPKVVFDKPAHGAYDASSRRYTPKAGFTGRDTITFAAVDYWGVSSKVGRVTVTVKPGSGPGITGPGARDRDRRAPSLALRAPASLGLGAALRRGILFSARTDEAGLLAVGLYVGRTTARHVGLRRHAAKRVRVGRVTRHILAGRTVVRARFSHRARTRLRHAGRVHLTLLARMSDAAGNARSRRVRIALVRAAAARALLPSRPEELP